MKALVALALLAIALAGCSGGGGGSDGVEPQKDDQGRYVIRMPNSVSFSPAVAKVPVGATVVWINDSSTAHDVNAADGSFSSDMTLGHKMAKGETFTHTFSAAGDFAYVCEIHEVSGMKGTVKVA